MGFLTDDIIQNASIKEKSYKLSHERSLYLFITKKGSKLWRLKYKFNKVDRTLSIGKYPDISIEKAMELMIQAKNNLAQGIDPNLIKRLNKKVKPSYVKRKVLEKDKYFIKISRQLTKINKSILKLIEVIKKK